MVLILMPMLLPANQQHISDAERLTTKIQNLKLNLYAQRHNFILHQKVQDLVPSIAFKQWISHLSHDSLALRFLPLAAESSDTTMGNLDNTGCVYRALGCRWREWGCSHLRR